MSDQCKVCDVSVPASKTTGRVSKWNVMKAQEAGWFFQKDGSAYCPAHVPEWVKNWRTQRAHQDEG